MIEDAFGFIEMVASLLTLGVASYGLLVWRWSFQAERAHEHLRRVSERGRAVRDAAEKLCGQCVEGIEDLNSAVEIMVHNPECDGISIPLLARFDRSFRSDARLVASCCAELIDALRDASVDWPEGLAERALQEVNAIGSELVSAAASLSRLRTLAEDPKAFPLESPESILERLDSCFVGRSSLENSTEVRIEAVLECARRAYRAMKRGGEVP